MLDITCNYLNNLYLSEQFNLKIYLSWGILIIINILIIFKLYKKLILLWLVLTIFNFSYALGSLIIPNECVRYEMWPLEEKAMFSKKKLTKEEEKRYVKLKKRPDIGPKLAVISVLGLQFSALFSFFIVIIILVLKYLAMIFYHPKQ